MATARQQPAWQQPIVSTDAKLPSLKIYNSLTKSKYHLCRLIPMGGEAKPYTKVLSDFKDTVSSLDKPDTIRKDILGLCDRLRDIDLFDPGIYLKYRENLPALVRPVTKELLQLREEKAAKLRQKQLEKEQREKEAREMAEKAEKGRLSHFGMFRTNEYSAWDDEGVPTRDAAGEEITKSLAKKLKDWERQKKLP